ncbi:hypothetical protein LNV23_16965 [Paucibacter sp. DJ1R-11]|uniref:hypothetical protein n=1 Tax=Paucibacter sp. DJ1R-11 TaxID=2893556 RepID=UPI0021E4F71E|nr:hypothetical protein [Paucibacter sp. DJ1R-11]MCV2365142.1 hypothetical protein [Paucibacter sp. DJ1R-11]
MIKTTSIMLLLAVFLSSGASAQDGKASKEREALRRAQGALREAQTQIGSLQAEKAALEAERARLAAVADGAKAQARGGEAKLKRSQQQQQEQAQAEMAALRREMQQNLDASAAREQALQQRVLTQGQELLERTQTTLSLRTLLERSTEALAEAEAKNRKLFAIGQDLVQLYLNRTPADLDALNDPLLGLGAVRMESHAESLRSQLAQQRTAR